jgi:HAD superfamily phosphatase
MKNSSVLVLDMDGVLAEVSESYLATIAATVQHFTGQAVSRETIEQYKQAGGWNNDWALAQKLILDSAHMDVAYPEVVSVFQSFFLGSNHDGLITRERWIPAADLLPRLVSRYALAIFSGRPRAEIDLTLARFAPDIRWQAIVGEEDVVRAKPAPDGLQAIAAAQPGTDLIYVGDNIDDARSARAADVSFIGIADPGQEQLIQSFRAEGAVAVIENVNQIEGVI